MREYEHSQVVDEEKETTVLCFQDIEVKDIKMRNHDIYYIT